MYRLTTRIISIFPIRFANTILLQLPRTCFTMLVKIFWVFFWLISPFFGAFRVISRGKNCSQWCSIGCWKIIGFHYTFRKKCYSFPFDLQTAIRLTAVTTWSITSGPAPLTSWRSGPGTAMGGHNSRNCTPSSHSQVCHITWRYIIQKSRHFMSLHWF